MNIDLSDALKLVLQKLSELEDKSRAELISESIYIYNYLHEELALGHHIYVCNSDNTIKEQIIFITPPPDKDAWFNNG